MTNHSERLGDLAAALARAQAQIDPAEADGVSSVGNGDDGRLYRYATLTSVWKAVRTALTENGLSVVQTCEPGEVGELRLVTTLLHQSGQWISGTMVVPLPTRTPQGYGSALTYARRYGLAAMVGLSVDRDDDGTAASQPPLPQPTARATTSGGDRHGSATAPRASGSAKPPDGGPSGPVVAWWQVPYNQANAGQFRAFAGAYARAKGVKSVGWEDIRRDFAIEGRLVDYFGATPLGQIVERVRKEKRGAQPTDSPEPAEGGGPPPDSEAA
ncbi:MAG: ERF family protein [Armatimonadota bacterium]